MKGRRRRGDAIRSHQSLIQLLALSPSRIDMLPFERRQGPVHDDRGHASVGDIFLAAIADAVLPGLGGERKSNEKQEGKDCANHEMSRVKAVRRPP